MATVDVLEFQVLSTIRNRIEFKKYQHLLSEEIFEYSQTRKLYSLIAHHHNNHESKFLTIEGLRALLYSAVKLDERKQYKVYLDKIRKHRIKDPEVLQNLIYTFARRQRLKLAIIEASELLEDDDNNDLERFNQRVNDAVGINKTSLEESYNYFHDPYRRVKDEANERRIKTKLSAEFDAAIDGGLAAGEIGIFIGPTGTGKSLCLGNVGYAALQQGKKIVYVTLELRPRKVARRLDVRITRKNFSEIRQDPGLVSKALKPLQTAGAGMQIKDYTSSICSVQDIRAYLERLRDKGFKCDLLLVDHVDLMYSPRHYKEMRHELSSIVASLRRLGGELKIPVWTASQGNRESGKKGKTRLWDIAEDIGKANWCDVAVTISQSEEDKEEGVLWLHIAKNRIGKNNPKLLMKVDYDIMKVYGRKEDKIQGLKRKLRDG